MPFGVTNAPSAFGSLMNMVYYQYLDKLIIIFIDDILVYSDKESDHETHLWMTLQILRDNQLYAKFSKCDLWVKEVNFLGHIISKNDLSVDLAKIQTILEWHIPHIVTDIRSFLGLASFYRRFIIDFPLIAFPMTS